MMNIFQKSLKSSFDEYNSNNTDLLSVEEEKLLEIFPRLKRI